MAEGSKKIPGLEPSSKEDGNLGDIGRAGSLHEFLQQLYDRFGGIAGFWWGQTYVVSIASPELFKQHVNIFDRPPLLFEMFKPFIGPASIQYANGTDGRYRRKNYDRAFEHSRLVMYYEKFQQVADDVVKRWEKKGKEDRIPLSDEMFTFSICASLITVLGDHFEDEDLCLRVKKAYDTMWSEMEYRLVHPVLPPDDDPRIVDFNEAKSFLHKTIKKIVEDRRKTTTQGNLTIDEIVASTDDEDIIASDCITFMTGSFHTTGNLLIYGLYYLAKHKECQDKLYKEIKDVLGDKDVVNDSNLNDLVYTHQVIDETMRCAMVGPWAARFQEKDSVLGGYKIPKNTPVIHALGVSMHNKKYFPEPTKFDPERFSAENIKDVPPLTFSPFGFAGKRKCPAYKYAYLESCVLLATVIRRFEVSLCDNTVVKSVHGLVTHPQDEIYVKVTQRK